MAQNRAKSPTPEYRAELVSEWEHVFGTPPPKRLSVEFIEQAIAYEAQCAEHGGLSKPIQARFKKLTANGQLINTSSRAPTPGTVLIREWNGVPHRVEIADGGYIYKSKVYNSLTAIAEVITGTHQSGPKFFGLQRKKHGA